MSEHILPDSRLANQTVGSVMVDWPVGDRTVRLEVAAIYCASCGVLFGYVPRENTTFCFWICNQCFEQYGAIAGTYAQPDEEFNRAVAYEIRERFGRDLEEVEIVQAMADNRLGPALEALARESPYPVRK